MVIITTVNQFDFVSAFKNSDTYKDNFSYEGLHLLYELLAEFSTDTGENLEFDLVGFCCDFAESTIEEFINDYSEVLEKYQYKYQLFLNDYLTDYIFQNLDTLLNNRELVEKYFSFILTKDNNYTNANIDAQLEFSYEPFELAQDMEAHLSESMEHLEFMKDVINVDNDSYYQEAIKELQIESITDYLYKNGGTYAFSDCQTFLVYQQF